MKTLNVTDESHKIVKLLCVQNDAKISDALDILFKKWSKDADNFGVFEEIKSDIESV